MNLFKMFFNVDVLFAGVGDNAYCTGTFCGAR